MLAVTASTLIGSGVMGRFSLAAEAPPVAAKPVSLLVAEEGWGGASSADVRKVLESTASHLCRDVTDLKLDPIDVRFGDDGPIVYYKRGDDNAHQVRLNTKDTYWAQYAFQFAHELCHILCGYRAGVGQNKWFEESLCELASLFTIRRMAESWKTEPPYPNWKSFAPKLGTYADDRMSKAKRDQGESLKEWYAANAEELRKSATNRDLNLVVATALLPVFETDPKAWDAVRTLNEGDANKRITFPAYLANWRKSSKPLHHDLIDSIAGQLGITFPV